MNVKWYQVGGTRTENADIKDKPRHNVLQGTIKQVRCNGIYVTIESISISMTSWGLKSSTYVLCESTLWTGYPLMTFDCTLIRNGWWYHLQTEWRLTSWKWNDEMKDEDEMMKDEKMKDEMTFSLGQVDDTSFTQLMGFHQLHVTFWEHALFWPHAWSREAWGEG